MELCFAVTENGSIYAMNIDGATGRLILERGSPRYGYKVPRDGVWHQDLLDNFRSAWTLAKEHCVSVNPYHTAAVYLD
jgi:hypothetical protein